GAAECAAERADHAGDVEVDGVAELEAKVEARSHARSCVHAKVDGLVEDLPDGGVREHDLIAADGAGDRRQVQGGLLDARIEVHATAELHPGGTGCWLCR